MEAKIVTTILPIKSRLSAKLQEARVDMVKTTTASNTTHQTPSIHTVSIPLTTDRYSLPMVDTGCTLPEKKKRKRYTKKSTSLVPVIVPGSGEFCDSTFSDESIVTCRTAKSTIRNANSPIGVSESLSVRQLDSNGSETFSTDGSDSNGSSLFDPSSDMYFSSMEYNPEIGVDGHAFPGPFDVIIPDEHVISAFPALSHHPQYRISQDLICGSSVMNSNVLRATAEEYISPKRRRRLNQIVPNPRKPRVVEYSCSCCSEPYTMSVQENPWWAVFSHECPSCKATQVPRFDINLPCNAIDLDPNIVALYGEGMEDEDCMADDDEDEDDDEVGEDGQDEEEPFGSEGTLDQDEASKLLVLMCHARTCTGEHESAKHADICKSTKFLMLHIRDCNGIDIYGNDCKFPWCTKCKRMLKHLTRCYEPSKCSICNPFTLPESFQQLQTINQVRVSAC